MSKALQIQSKMEEFLMIYSDTVNLISASRREDMAENNLALEMKQRVINMMEQHKNVQELIDDIPEEQCNISNEIVEQYQLKKIFIERDIALGLYENAKKNLEEKQQTLQQCIKILSLETHMKQQE